MSQARSVYHFNSVIVREPSHSVVNGLRADDRGNPTYEGVKAEHDAYIAAMRDAGVEVTVLPALEAFPDSIFVEDPALVFPEGAILLRPGALSRVGETAEITPTLRDMFETVLDLPSPGFADGGDVQRCPAADNLPDMRGACGNRALYINHRIALAKSQVDRFAQLLAQLPHQRHGFEPHVDTDVGLLRQTYQVTAQDI